MQKLTVLSAATFIFFHSFAMDHPRNSAVIPYPDQAVSWFKAVRSGNTFKAHTLRNLGCDVNLRNESNASALHIILTHKKTVDMRMLTYLLDSNANTSLQDGDGNTPLHIALTILNKCLNRIRKATAHGDLAEEKYRARKQELRAQQNNGSLERTEAEQNLISLKNEQKLLRKSNKALIASHQANAKLYCSAVVHLLVHGASTTIPNQTMPQGYQTAQEIWPDLLKNLDELVCVRAISLDKDEIVSKCLAAGIDPNSPQEHIGSFLTWAVEHKALKATRQILYFGGLLNIPNDNQDAPLKALDIAAIQKNAAMVKVLLESPQGSPCKLKSSHDLNKIQQEMVTFVLCCAQKDSLINTLNNGEIVHSICQFLLPNLATLINEVPLAQLPSFVAMRLFQKYFYQKQNVIDALTKRHVLIGNTTLRAQANLSIPFNIMPCDLARIHHDAYGQPFIGAPNETSTLLDPQVGYLESQQDMIKSNYAQLLE